MCFHARHSYVVSPGKRFPFWHFTLSGRITYDDGTWYQIYSIEFWKWKVEGATFHCASILYRIIAIYHFHRNGSFLWLIQFIFTFFDTFVSERWEICKIGYKYTSNVTNILWMFRHLWFKDAKIYGMHRMHIIMQKCMKYQRCSYLADERKEREKLICIKIHSLVRNFWLSKFS